jgi:hypothetical protein
VSTTCAKRGAPFSRRKRTSKRASFVPVRVRSHVRKMPRSSGWMNPSHGRGSEGAVAGSLLRNSKKALVRARQERRLRIHDEHRMWQARAENESQVVVGEAGHQRRRQIAGRSRSGRFSRGQVTPSWDSSSYGSEGFARGVCRPRSVTWCWGRTAEASAPCDEGQRREGQGRIARGRPEGCRGRPRCRMSRSCRGRSRFIGRTDPPTTPIVAPPLAAAQPGASDPGSPRARLPYGPPWVRS